MERITDIIDIIENAISEPCEGVLVEPAAGSMTNVLVLAGSSGRVDTGRCRVLARAGMTAMSIRWFGGACQPPGICEVPLEAFVAAIDVLRARGGGRTGVQASSPPARRRACRSL